MTQMNASAFSWWPMERLSQWWPTQGRVKQGDEGEEVGHEWQAGSVWLINLVVVLAGYFLHIDIDHRTAFDIDIFDMTLYRSYVDMFLYIGSSLGVNPVKFHFYLLSYLFTSTTITYQIATFVPVHWSILGVNPAKQCNIFVTVASKEM
jgi:hypothetical protein